MEVCWAAGWGAGEGFLLRLGRVVLRLSVGALSLRDRGIGQLGRVVMGLT